MSIMSDNGPNLHHRNFKDLSSLYNFQLLTALLGYHQSDGFVEQMIKTMNVFMQKFEE